MRTSSAFVLAIVAGLSGPAFALDTPLVGPDTPAADALRSGLNALKGGNVAAALDALKLAADKGLVSARWKLAEMYATGDGVTRDDLRAFRLFSDIANNHA